jgi:hypothetical protein
VKFNALKLQHTQSACTGEWLKTPAGRAHTLNELVGEGLKFKFRLEKWDGRWVTYCNVLNPILIPSRCAIPITDMNDKVISLCTSSPDDSSWGSGHQSMVSAIDNAYKAMHFNKKDLKHCHADTTAGAVSYCESVSQQEHRFWTHFLKLPLFS